MVPDSVKEVYYGSGVVCIVRNKLDSYESSFFGLGMLFTSIPGYGRGGVPQDCPPGSVVGDARHSPPLEGYGTGWPTSSPTILLNNEGRGAAQLSASPGSFFYLYFLDTFSFLVFWGHILLFGMLFGMFFGTPSQNR